MVRDLLDNMIVTLTTIMDSQGCPEYRAGRHCVRIAQVSSKTTKYSDFRVVVTQWIGSESTQHEWDLEKGSSALATGFENS